MSDDRNTIEHLHAEVCWLAKAINEIHELVFVATSTSDAETIEQVRGVIADVVGRGKAARAAEREVQP